MARLSEPSEEMESNRELSFENSQQLQHKLVNCCRNHNNTSDSVATLVLAS